MGLTYHLDTDGRNWDGRDFIQTLADVGRAPVFTVFSHFIGSGSMGGVVLDRADAGRRAMSLVTRILDGEPASAIPVEHGGPYPTVLDWRELERWRVPNAFVPAGAEVRFHEPGPWRRYSREILLLGTVLLFQTLLILVLLIERRRRRAAERQAREDRSVIAHLNRVGAIGELAGSFAHEINTPLGAVVNNAEAARRFLASGPERSTDILACLDDIVGDALRAGDVVRRMRGVMRRDDPRRVPVDLAAIIRDAVRLVEAEARDRDVALELAAAADLPALTGDDVQLVQVVLNLVMNAIDALATVPPERRHVAVTAAPVRQGVEIRVADTGPGIPPAQLEKIFEPFVTSKPSGLGLGLAISRSIVEAHGGSIRVLSGPGDGADFRVFLPASGGTHRAEHEAPQAAAAT
jgi:signal transduction histidine kinase